MSSSTRAYRQRWWWWALMGVICVVAIVPARQGPPTEGQSDERLFALASQLKCQQCVGESVADSQSPSAIQFREEIRSQMAQGRTDDEILDYFSRPERFDQQVLLTPPSSGIGSLVWILPVLVAAGAVALLAATFRRWRTESTRAPLTDADRARVEAALGRGGAPGTAPQDSAVSGATISGSTGPDSTGPGSTGTDDGGTGDGGTGDAR